MASGEFGFYNYVDDTNGWVDVLGLARTYSAREQALPQHLKDRPKWRKKTKKQLDSTTINGKFYDAKTGKEIKRVKKLLDTKMKHGVNIKIIQQTIPKQENKLLTIIMILII